MSKLSPEQAASPKTPCQWASEILKRSLCEHTTDPHKPCRRCASPVHLLPSDIAEIQEEAIEHEQARWQKRIYQELCDAAAAAELNINIDGGGCDSGDPLDFTTDEISQVLNALTEQLRAKSDPRTYCVWTVEPLTLGRVKTTSCGAKFDSPSGHLTFCPYCANKIKESQ